MRMSRQSKPLLVHRTRSATGHVLDGWLEGHEVLNDGFFLAQRSGDAPSPRRRGTGPGCEMKENLRKISFFKVPFIFFVPYR